MKEFNWRTGLESRPIEDQDLEDTTKPAPDAGQIDGDTTTLSGQAKPGQNPVPDQQDVKIDERPVDLDDVILIDQDRRAYQPLVSDAASAMAVDEQNIAQEGWIGKKIENVKDFFTRREKEIEDGYTATKDNLADLEKLRQKLRTRPGEVHAEADTISLGKYAKWLSLNGKHVTDASQLVRELERIYQFVQWADELDKAYIAAYKFVAESVWKLGESDLQKATDNLKQLLTVAKPHGVDRWLTEKETNKFNGKDFVDRKSPAFIGQWFLFEMSQEADAAAPGGIVKVVRHNSMKSVKGSEFPALTKDQMSKIIDVCEKIENHLASSKSEWNVVDRYLDALDEFAYRYRNFNSLSREDQALVKKLYSWGQIIVQNDTTFLPTAFSNHIVKVLISYVEKSMRRIEVAK